MNCNTFTSFYSKKHFIFHSKEIGLHYTGYIYQFFGRGDWEFAFTRRMAPAPICWHFFKLDQWNIRRGWQGWSCWHDDTQCHKAIKAMSLPYSRLQLTVLNPSLHGMFTVPYTGWSRKLYPHFQSLLSIKPIKAQISNFFWLVARSISFINDVKFFGLV